MFRVEGLSFLDWERISLEIDAGEILVLLGNSGSGKSLLLRSMADLIPHTGEAFLEERLCVDFLPTEWRALVSFLPAEILWWEESVGLHFEELPSEDLLESLGIGVEAMEWPPHRLSMGERQRLGILRTLDRKPRVLLLDEPTSNLDEESANRVEALIQAYVLENRACVLWVSHSEEQAKRLGNRLIRMADKRVVEVELG